MFNLNAKIRAEAGKKTNLLKGSGRIPAVVYGHNMAKNDIISVDNKEFIRIFKEAGENSLIEILIDGSKDKRIVLVHDLQKDPISGNITHIDFFQPNLKEEVEVSVPLVFEGIAPAEKDLGGTLNKNILEIEVKALPQNLPHEIKADVSVLKTFEDHILVKDLAVPNGVILLKGSDEIVAAVLPPQKIEEELATEITENVEDIEKVAKEKKQEEVIEEAPEESASAKSSDIK